MKTKELIDALRNENETDASAMMDYMADAADLLEKQQNKIGDLEYEAQEREKIVVQLRKQWQDAEMFICSMCGHFDRKTDGNIVYGNQDCGEIVGYPYCKKFTPWIPTSVRLPEPEKRVLILTKAEGWNGKDYREIMCGFYEDGNVWCEDSKVCWDWDYEMKREENYDESRDDYRVPEGWFEELLNHIDDYNCVAIGDVVTHWMPLPEMPKEEVK